MKGLDLDIEWLFEEVYRRREENPSNPPVFVSDWDVISDHQAEFAKLLTSVFKVAETRTSKYVYGYEQFSLKRQLIDFARKISQLSLDESNLVLSPSATASIYLLAQGLKSLNLTRILLITPAYFAVHDSLHKAQLKVFYYHLKDQEELQLNFEAIGRIIKEQNIHVLFLTDPVYSSGYEFTINDYKEIVNICFSYDVQLIVDYSLGGLLWESNKGFILPAEKIKAIQQLPKFAFIDTLSKRLLLNGVKFSLLIGDNNIVDKVDLNIESVYGGLNSIQSTLIGELYNESANHIVDKLCNQNLKEIKEHFALVTTHLYSTDFYLPPTNSGYFTVINHKNYKLEDINTRKYALTMLNQQNVVVLTKERFSYYQENKFGFRINLNLPINRLLIPINQCIRQNFEAFHKRN